MTRWLVVVLAAWLAPSTLMALTATPTAQPTVPVPIPCVGDCNGSFAVTIDELLTCVNIALGAPTFICLSCDADRDGVVAIDELLAAVTANLSGCGADDGFEPDNNPTQAVRIACGGVQHHSLVPFGDQDWMRLSLDRLSGVVLATTGSQGGDPVMTLQDATLSPIAYNDDSGSSFPIIQRQCGINALAAGDYYITMSGLGGSVVPQYDILVSCEPCSVPNPTTPTPTPTPIPDAYEPDNTFDLANPIACGEIQSHSFTDVDADWVKFTLTTRSTVHILATAPFQALPLELHSGDGSLLQFSYGVLQKNCGVDALEAGSYAVYTNGFTLTDYSLALLCDPCADANPTPTPTPTFPPAPTPLPPDAFEDDDARERAVPIDCGSGIFRSIAPAGDTDWYVLDVPQRAAVVIQQFANGGLNLALQDEGGRDLEYTYGQPIVRACGVNALDSGRYFVELSSLFAAPFGYDLLVTCAPCGVPNPPTMVPPTRTPTPTPLMPDRFEPDDGPEEASALSCGTLQPHSLDNPFDQDWAEFTLPANSAVSITASSVNFTLYNDFGSVLFDNYQFLDLTCQQPLPAGRYFIRTGCQFCGAPITAYNLSLVCGECGGPATATPTATPTPTVSPTPFAGGGASG